MAFNKGSVISEIRLKPILEGYKSYFPKHWDEEKYKWQAVKVFQETWDIEAKDFASMFEAATGKTGNLLTSGFFDPRRHIIELAKADVEAVRAMFRRLYDETLDLKDRMLGFAEKADELWKEFGSKGNHDQEFNAISIYLWLRYPDKYFIFKSSYFRNARKELLYNGTAKEGRGFQQIEEAYQIYGEMRKALLADDSIRKTLDKVLTDDCYPDPELYTMTHDLSYYMANDYIKGWFPQDYSPNLKKKDWIALLNDPEVFNENSRKVIKCLKDHDGQSTCKDLENAYGNSFNFYKNGIHNLADRIHKSTHCPTMSENTKDSQLWPIVCLGRTVKGSQKNDRYMYRLRDELSEALDDKRVDLSDVPLYENDDTAPESADADSSRPYTREDFLREVFMPEEEFDRLEGLLKYKKNVILQGAPGVGKTFAAKRLAYAMMETRDESRIEMVQFHQNYSYEDFVMGYRPNGDGFALKEGIFCRFCEAAAGDPENGYFFLIDEINRGNLSKIFGELLMLIENEYRGKAHAVRLAYSDEPFYVPENLYIIGMMNTADRSLALIDYALRRRFSFYEMQPAFDSEGFRAMTKEFDPAFKHRFDVLIDAVRKLNVEIASDPSLGRGFEIGHSYFCLTNPEDRTTARLRDIVEYEILPMLAEYWFDNRTKYVDMKNQLIGALEDD